ncbi:uncharacterized protein LOC134289856 [Aedes albopictus]|uniref:Uncharacterized protein n=1 Tax=Aedes albopictus TaxID=7160 RepID=A0ABM1XRH0_AEDAL
MNIVNFTQRNSMLDSAPFCKRVLFKFRRVCLYFKFYFREISEFRMSLLEKVEKINVIVDAALDDPEIIEEENHNPELEKLICEWNLSPAIYAILVQHGFTVEYLEKMDEKSLDDVFSVTKWTGHKFALRQKLVLWPKSVMCQSASTSSVSQSAPAAAPVVLEPTTVKLHTNPFKHRLLPTSVTSELLRDILSRNEKGKIVVKYFETHQSLNVTHRKYLAHTVVDYYIANDLYFPLPDMAKFAQLIAERFSNEFAETYYNPRDIKAEKKHPSGLIYDRFHNRNKKALIKPKSSTDKENIFRGAKSTALNLSEEGN